MSNKVFSTLFLVLFGLGIFAALWVQSNVNHKFPSDIDIYLRAGQKAFEKENPYQPFEIGASFIYPPTALLIFTPLSLLHSPKNIWAAINIISLLFILAIMLRMTSINVRNSAMILLTSGAILYAPFMEQLTIGQINTLVLLGIAVFMLGITNPRYKQVGDLGLAIAISIKITPIVLLAYPFILRDWHRLRRVLIYLLMLMFISLLLFGFLPWMGFWEILPKLFQGYPGTINHAITPSINWLARNFIIGTSLTWVGPLFSVLVLILWISALVFQAKTSNPVAVLSFGIAGMTISSSLIWYHHLVFLLIPIIFLILSLDVRTRMGKIILLLTLAGTMLIQIDRIFEAKFALPPLASIAGYLAIYLATGLSLYSPLPTKQFTTSSYFGAPYTSV